jgi:hypothetical protein
MKTLKPILCIITILSLLVYFSACKESFLDSLDLPDEFELTHLPTDLSQMHSFGPMGQIRVIPKMHGGFYLLNPYSFPATVPVYAMGDGYIINIIQEFRTVVDHHAPEELQGIDYDDFTLDIVYSKHAGGYYGHVSALSDEILEQAGEIRKGRGVRNQVKIKITAGQVLGYVGPHPGLDIGMYDHEREHYFANPSMYGRDYRSSVCYTDYLPAPLREEIWAINPRTAEPRCGRVAYDKEGTLAGNWFLEGTTEITQWSRQLVFVWHDLYGDQIMIVDASPLVDGDGILNDGLDPYAWFVKGNSPEPESITVGSGPVKYEAITWWRALNYENPEVEGTVLVQLLDSKTLQYEWFEGKIADEVSGFTGNSRIYKR